MNSFLDSVLSFKSFRMLNGMKIMYSNFNVGTDLVPKHSRIFKWIVFFCLCQND